MNSCLKCGKQTENAKYCSNHCFGRSRETKEYFCPCGVSKGFGFEKSLRKYCDECHSDPQKNKNYSIWHTITISEFREKMPNINQFHARIRSLARRNKKLTPCEKCGYSRHVEVCHKISVKDFDQNRPISELNHESNLMCLCPNCHWEHDNPETNIEMEPKRKIPDGNKNFSEPHPHLRKVERPSYDELQEMVISIGYEATGRSFGVTGNSIRKWIKIYEKHSKVANAGSAPA